MAPASPHVCHWGYGRALTPVAHQQRFQQPPLFQASLVHSPALAELGSHSLFLFWCQILQVHLGATLHKFQCGELGKVLSSHCICTASRERSLYPWQRLQAASQHKVSYSRKTVFKNKYIVTAVHSHFQFFKD